MLPSVEGPADRPIVAEDRQLVSDLKNGVSPCGLVLPAGALDQHDQDARLRAQSRLGQRLAPVFLRDVHERHARDAVVADVVQQQHGVEGPVAHEVAVRRLLHQPVAPGADLRHTHEDKDHRDNGQRNQDTDEKVFKLARFEGEKDVDKRGEYSDVEHIAEEHCDPREAAPLPGREDDLALLRGVAGAGQQGANLKARPLIRQTRQAKQHGDQLRDDPVQEYDDGEQRQSKVYMHASVSPFVCRLGCLI